MNKQLDHSKYYFADTSFNLLMRKRVTQVLLICSKYDAFILEEDGRIDEQIFMEYVSLNLRYPPQFIQASTAQEAFNILREEKIDLIINMLSVGGMDPFELSIQLKRQYPEKPIVVLTPFSREVSLKLQKEDTSAINYKFCWLGNADILLAIVKLIEDNMNSDHDINEVGVQSILLVEDSIRYYSSYLPNIYKIIFKQSKKFMTEGLNEHQKMLRMRGRPKILLATNFEEAVELYEKYKNNLLGVISDISYKRIGKRDKQAGFRLAEKIMSEDKYMPVLLQSSDESNGKKAEEIGAGFIYKYSKTLSIELRNFIVRNFAFGDFIFRNPETMEEITRARDLKNLQEKIFQVPDESLEYHINRNHFSRWLNARALFPVAQMMKYVTSDDFDSIEQIKYYIFDTIARYRSSKGRGIIAKFYRDSFDEYLNFTRIGEGSIGGKARGLAFVDSLIKRNRLIDRFQDVAITIPRTVVLSTDVFDQFMEENDLYKIGLSDASDEKILNAFVMANLPFRIHKDLYTFISVVKNPIAIRSSSLLEDSHYQPFAGIYSTYMIPKIESEMQMIENLSNAIKSVYASVFFKDSKAYMAATSNVIDEEKMGVVLQEVCGTKYGNHFYPNISGVARSVNFYPIEPEKTEDGTANIALGLGKYIVDGGQNLRFSPKFPKKVLQLSTPEMALRETQKSFYSLDLSKTDFVPTTDDSENLLQLKIKDAENDGSLKQISSTYDFQNNILRDGSIYEGKKVLTFSGVLKYNKFPLAEILQEVLEIGQAEMNNPIEIEFAVNLDTGKGNLMIFNLLQIRPIVNNDQSVEIDLKNIADEELLIKSENSLGNGIINEICDFVYVKPDAFSRLKTAEMVESIENLNTKLCDEGLGYILVGPGRWGSSDPNLGIPVRWAQISGARLIVESGLSDYRVDPSQGTHFFQNITSFRVGYFTINTFINEGYIDFDYLNSQKAHFEDDFVKHIKFNRSMEIQIDGRKSTGVVLKPKD